MGKKYTDPADIKEVEELMDTYSVDNFQTGCYLIDDWLFIWPRRQRWGERYKNQFGYYQRGDLRHFVEHAIETGEMLGKDKKVYHMEDTLH